MCRHCQDANAKTEIILGKWDKEVNIQLYGVVTARVLPDDTVVETYQMDNREPKKDY